MGSEFGRARQGVGSNREFNGLAEDLQRHPVRQLGHARHTTRHGTGGIDDPGIVPLLEPQGHHVVLPVGGAKDDRPKNGACGSSKEEPPKVDGHILAFDPSGDLAQLDAAEPSPASSGLIDKLSAIIG